MLRLIGVAFILLAQTAWCQNRFWVASSQGNWNDVNNWSTSSGGASGASVPGSGNVAIFNANGTGECVLDIAPTVGGITMDGYGDSIDVNGNTFSITGAIDFTDGVIYDGSTGGDLSINSTGTVYFRGTQMDVPVTCSAARLYLNGTTFNQQADLTHTGGSNAHGNGGNVFNDSTWIRNSGSSYVLTGNASPDTFRVALELENTGTNRIYLAHAAAGSYFDCNIVLNNTSSEFIAIGNNGGTSALTSGNQIQIGSSGYSAAYLYLRNMTQLGSTAQSITLTGTARLYIDDMTWNGNVSFTSPSFYTFDTRYNGTLDVVQNGTVNTASNGGNYVAGNTTLTCSGSGYLLLGNTTADTFAMDVTMNNTGTYRMYLANNGANNYIGGDLLVNSSGSGTDNNIYISNGASASLNIAGKCTINQASSATSSTIYLGEQGDVTVGDSLNLTNNGTGTTSQISVANNSNSTTVLNGPVVANNQGSITTSRIYLGSSGDITFNGNLTVNNTSTSSNSQVYLQNGSSSANTYNENIVINSSGTNCDGIFFGNSGGSGTLAATKTISIGTGFTDGNLYLRNFTQTGATAQALTITGTGYIYNYDNQWGGNVNFVAPRIFTRGSTYSGTAYLEKTGASDDNSVGGNTFTGNATLVNSGSRYFMMGNGSPDVFSGDLTLNNTGSYFMYLGQSSAGNTIAGNLYVNNSGSGTSAYVYVSNGSASTVSVTGKTYVENTTSATTGNVYLGSAGDLTLGDSLIVNNSPTGTNGTFVLGNASTSQVIINGPTVINNTGSGTTHVSYFGNSGDVTQNGNLTLTNTSDATTSDIRCAYEDSSVVTINGNLQVSSTNASSDGVNFGNSNGSATLASGNTVTVGSTFIGGNLIFRNFTQTGNTAQSLTITGTGYIQLYDSQWGGNVNFTAPRMFVQGSTLSGTTYLEKTGSTNDYSTGGNTFTGEATFVHNGSDVFALGNGSPDVFSNNAIITNSGTGTFSLAQNSAGNTIAGNLTATHSTSGTSTNLYVSNGANSTISITGKTYLTNTSTSTTGNMYLANSGDATLGDSLIIVHSPTGTSGTFYLANADGSEVTVNGPTTLTNSGSGTTKNSYVAQSGDITFNGNLHLTNSANATTSLIYCNNEDSSDNAYNGNIEISSTDASSDGIYFGNGGGNGTLASGQTITVGSTFIGGHLILRNFTQIGTTAQAITTAGTGYQLHYDSQWGGNVTFIGARMNSRGTTYSGTAYLEKTGATDDYSVGGNTFTGSAQLINSGSGLFAMGNGTGDVFSSDLTMNNTGSYHMHLAYNSSGNTVAGDLTATNATSGTSAHLYLSNGSNSSLAVSGKLRVTNTSTATTGNLVVAGTGDLTVGDSLIFNHSPTGTNGTSYIASAHGSVVTITGPASITNGGGGTTKITYVGNSGDITFNDNLELINNATATSCRIYCNNEDSSTNAYNGNIEVSSTDANSDGVYFGNGEGNGTLASGRTITVGSSFVGGDLYFRNFTQVGGTAQSATITGTGYIYHYDSQWGGNVSFSGPRMVTRGSTFSGTAYLEKTGASDDASTGGNTFTGNAEIRNSGSGRVYMGNGTADTYSSDLTVTNSGSSSFNLAHNSSGNTVGGDLILVQSNSGTGGSMSISSCSTCGLTVTGKVNATNTGSATTSSLYLGDGGDLSIGDSLTIEHNSTATTADTYIGDDATSAVTVSGHTTINNTGSGTNHRVYLGNNGDITFTGNLNMVNNSTATNNQFYCNNNSNSVNAYNGNIVVSSTNAASDGMYWGNGGGSGTLAATRTISVGTSFISGYLYFRNFTQVGATAQTLAITGGTGYLYNYDSDWGGDVTFSGPRHYTRGTTYQGAATLEKNGASDDLSIGGNSFAGDVVLTSSGSGYFGMGNGSSDSFGGNLTMNNTGTYRMYLANNSAGNTVAGDLTLNNSPSGSSSPYVYLSNGSASTLAITGKLIINNTASATNAYIYVGESGDVTVGDSCIYTGTTTGTNAQLFVANQTASSVTFGDYASFSQSGAGTTYRMYLGNNGDVTFNGDLVVVTSSSATNSQVYLNNTSNSVNAYNGNIQVSSTNSSGDGIFFGNSSGNGTLASGRTITIGSTFDGGQLYFRNFTQSGSTAQSLALGSNSTYLYNYDSEWGGNVTFSAPQIITRGTTYSGTAYIEKNGANSDASPGGNSFVGNAELTNSGSGYFLMGNGTADAFTNDVTLTNTGTYRMYLAYNSAGNTVGGDLTVNNSPTGTSSPYVYVSDQTNSTLAVTGKVTVNNTSSATNSNVYIGNNGDMTIGDSLVITNNCTGTNSHVYVATGTNSSVTVTGHTAVTNNGTGTTYRVYLGSNGDVTFNNTLTLTNNSTATNSQIYCNNSANSSNQYNANITVASTASGCDGIYFGNSGGTGTLSAGNTVNVGSFISGNLYYRNFTQNGSAAHTATITAGTGYVYNYDCTWGGNVTFSAPRIYSRGSTYNGTSSFTKTGASNDASPGGNTHNGDVTFSNSGTGYLMQGNGTADDYNGNVSYIKTSTGLLYPAYNATCTYAGNISFNTNTAVTLAAAGNGRLTFDGSGAQSINDLASSTTPIFRRITLDNSASEITLNMPITINSNLTFSNGNLVSDATNYPTLNDNTTVSGASDNSHIDGPIAKIGNDAFTFPTGDNGVYRALSISAPSSGSANFQAEFIASDPRSAIGSSVTSPVDHVSQLEYWTLARNASTSSVTVTLSWGPGSGEVTNLTDLVVSHYSGGTWISEGNGGTTGNTTTGTVVSSGSISSFSPFSLGSITSENPLPVELISFEAIPNVKENVVDLLWVTASEVNNDYFTVERTQDLDWFETVVEVEGAGTTNERTEYHEVDAKPLEGVSYYRLKQTDFDGKETKFDLRKVSFNPEKDIDIQLYPNPNDGMNLFLQIPNNSEDELNVLISDFLGKEYLIDFSVYNHGTHSVITMELNKTLAPGSYFVNIEVGGKVYTHKLIVQ